MLETGWALFFGDNLDILSERIPEEYVGLIYLDPPSEGTPALEQIKAFEATWSWDQAAAEAFADLVEEGARCP
jgi:site-specific DNA-methyltransferase (adenine-specific)